MEWLEKLLKEHVGEDKLESVIAEVKKVFPEHAVPKEQYNKKATALESAETELETTRVQMAEVNDKLGKITATNGDVDALKSTIKELEEFKDGEGARTAEVESRIKKGMAFERALYASKVDPSLIPLFKKENADKVAEMALGENDALVGVDDLIAGVKTQYPNSFSVTTTADPAGPPAVGATPPVDNGAWYHGNQQ